MSNNKGILTKLWDKAVHGFTSDYIDDNGRPIIDHRYVRMLDIPEFKVSAAIALMNGTIASENGLLMSGIAAASSLVGGIYSTKRFYDHRGDKVLHKTPNDDEIEKYGAVGYNSALNYKHEEQESNKDVVVISAVAVGMGCTTNLMATYIMAPHIDNLPTVISAAATAFPSAVTGLFAATVASYFTLNDRMENLFHKEWIELPPGTDLGANDEESSLYGRLKEALFPPAAPELL